MLKYFGPMVSADNSMHAKLKHRLGEGVKIMGELVDLWRNGGVRILENIAVHTVLY